MPIETRDLDGGLGSTMIAWGLLREGEFVDLYEKHFGQDAEKFRKYRYNISDYTELTKVDVSSHAIRWLAGLAQNKSKINPESVIAIVVAQDLIFGLARMWAILMDGFGWEVMVFRDRNDAEIWIRKRMMEKYRIGDLTFS